MQRGIKFKLWFREGLNQGQVEFPSIPTLRNYTENRIASWILVVSLAIGARSVVYWNMELLPVFRVELRLKNQANQFRMMKACSTFCEMIFTLKMSCKASLRVQETRVCALRFDSYALAPDSRGSWFEKAFWALIESCNIRAKETRFGFLLINAKPCDSRKINHLTGELHVKFHLKSQYRTPANRIFAWNLTWNSLVKWFFLYNPLYNQSNR